MKISAIILLFITACSFNDNEKNCRALSVYVSQADTFEVETDREYSVGDDDLFMANEMKIYQLDKGNLNDVSSKLNDYDLSTSMDYKFDINSYDTFMSIFSFPGLNEGINTNTLGVIDGITVFNGNRKNLSQWEKSGKIDQVQIFYNNKLQGCARLKSTFKYQKILLEREIPLLRGKSDTLSLVIKSIYPLMGIKHNQFTISELKIEGRRLY